MYIYVYVCVNICDGGSRCPSTPVQAGRRTTRRRTVGRSHSVRWERASGGQRAKVSATSLDQVSSKARKRAPEQHRRGAQHHRGAPAHRARTHRRGGGQQAPTAGGQHRRAGGPQRGTTPRGAPAHKGAAPTRQQVPTRILCSSSDGDRERFSLDLPKKSETIRGTWSRNGN